MHLDWRTKRGIVRTLIGGANGATLGAQGASRDNRET